MNARLSVHRSILGSLACALVACSGASPGSLTTGTATSEEAEALAAAAESASSYDAQAEQCGQAFLSCVSAAGADVAKCVAALEACLPGTPPVPPGCEGDGDADGPGDAGMAPPPPPPPAGIDGGPPGQQQQQQQPPPPPPPPPPPGEQGDGGAPHGGPPPYCGMVPLPPPAALIACRKTLESCMQAATDDTGRQACVEAEHACAKAAFEAAGAPGN